MKSMWITLFKKTKNMWISLLGYAIWTGFFAGVAWFYVNGL